MSVHSDKRYDSLPLRCTPVSAYATSTPSTQYQVNPTPAQQRNGTAPFTAPPRTYHPPDAHLRQPWRAPHPLHALQTPVAYPELLPSTSHSRCYSPFGQYMHRLIPPHAQPIQVHSDNDSYLGTRKLPTSRKQRSKRRDFRMTKSSSATRAISTEQFSQTSFAENEQISTKGSSQRPRSQSFPIEQVHHFHAHKDGPNDLISPINSSSNADTKSPGPDEKSLHHTQAKTSLFKRKTLNDIRFDQDMSLFCLRTASQPQSKCQVDTNDRNELLQVLHEKIDHMSDPEEAAICLEWMHEVFHEMGDKLKRIRGFAWLDLYSPMHEDLFVTAMDEAAVSLADSMR